MFKFFYAFIPRYKIHIFYLSFLIVLMTYSFYATHDVKRVVTVNITALQDSFIKETVAQHLSPEDAKDKVSQFSKLMNEAIFNLSNNKQMIVLPREAVLAGSIDETNIVAHYIKARMAK